MATTHIDHAGIFGLSHLCDIAADGKTRIAKFLSIFNIVAPGDWHVIHNPARTHTHTQIHNLQSARFSYFNIHRTHTAIFFKDDIFQQPLTHVLICAPLALRLAVTGSLQFSCWRHKMFVLVRHYSTPRLHMNTVNYSQTSNNLLCVKG